MLQEKRFQQWFLNFVPNPEKGRVHLLAADGKITRGYMVPSNPNDIDKGCLLRDSGDVECIFSNSNTYSHHNDFSMYEEVNLKYWTVQKRYHNFLALQKQRDLRLGPRYLAFTAMDRRELAGSIRCLGSSRKGLWGTASRSTTNASENGVKKRQGYGLYLF